MTKAERVCELLIQYERDRAMPRHFTEKNEGMAYNEVMWAQPLRDAILLAQEVVCDIRETRKIVDDLSEVYRLRNDLKVLGSF